MIRDFNNTLLQAYNSYPAITSLITNKTSKARPTSLEVKKSNPVPGIHTFQPDIFANAHLNGHSFISGEDNDLFTSPGDPLFWFHHAQMDRIDSIWQAQDFASREYALDGTLTMRNSMQACSPIQRKNKRANLRF